MNLSPTTSEQTSLVQKLAKEHAISESAVEVLYAALQRGGGGMAQFSHPELGGSGQWMRNGMIMVGDMFNQSLKAKIDAICQALLPHLGDRSTAASFSSSSPMSKPLSESPAWWPSEYTSPAATGGQNDFRYAYFPQSDALAVEQNGETVVYDTTGHDLHGFGQQQRSSSGFTLHSTAGAVDLSKFPKKKATPTAK